MGNYKKNKKQKLEMKFFAFVALLGSAAAIKLTHQAPHTHKLAHSQIKAHMKTKWENLTDEQEQEIEDWVVEELTTGEETITKQEAHDAIVAFGEKHGFEPLSEEDWEELEEIFDYVDSNGDGEIDLEELMAAMEEYEEE